MNSRNCLLASILILAASTACSSTSKPITAVSPVISAGPSSVTESQRTEETQPSKTHMDRLSPALRMNVPRAAHTATLLPDGHVLIAGGFREEGTREIAIANAEIYDPDAQTFTPTGDMNEARSSHTATLLPNGLVLIVGGWGPNQRTGTAELYDPRIGKFNYTASMSGPRASMTATLLKDGRVIIIGGDSARNVTKTDAEIYDPESNTFSAVVSLNEGRSAHTATLLDDGSVLIVGGSSGNQEILSSAEIYNPLTDTFTLTGSMGSVRHKHAAVLLPDGGVLVLGGSNQLDWQGKYTSAEIYDVEAGIFLEAPSLNKERFKLSDAVILLDDGNVLIGGGNRQLEIFEKFSQRFVQSEQLDNHYYFSVLTRLFDGNVLITGGYDPDIQPTDQAWIFNKKL